MWKMRGTFCTYQVLNKEFPVIPCDFNEWSDRVDVFEINRENARSFFIPYSDIRTLLLDVKENPINSSRIKDGNNIKVLNGKWRFYLDYKVKDRNTEFFKNDYDVSSWDFINVPSNWQTEGYDFPIYVNFKYPWTGFENLEFYKAPEKFNPIGNYKTSFFLDDSWIGSEIYISFQGVESSFYLWVNGGFAGYSEDSFSPSEFNITEFLVEGENTISVQVFRWSDGSFIEDQDFVRLSGIFRDVFLYKTPKLHIRDFEVSTDLDDDYINSKLSININLLNHYGEDKSFSISAILFDDDWNLVNKVDTLGDFSSYYLYKDKTMECSSNISLNVHNPFKWSSEEPNLYNLILCLKNDSLKEIECIHQRVGFREFEMKGNKMHLNGVPILFKGVNRHEAHPVKGRALNETDMEFDIKEIKRNNINSVRTSHYPNHPYFLSLCNEYGLYVIDEASIEAHGVEGEIPGDKEIWRGACFDRIKSLIERDKNNPSVLIWSIGNESGGGSIFKDIYSYVKNRDPKRLVHYEGEKDFYYASDIVSKMYVKSSDIEVESNYIKEKPYILCEYAHSMGNSGGNLHKYMEKFESLDNVQGGFIWDFIDQGIYKERPSMGSFYEGIFSSDFEGYIKEGYRKKGFSGCILYNGSENISFDEFTIDLMVKPSIYEGEGCVYLKKGNEFGIVEISNYNKTNNKAVEFYVRDISGAYETIVFLTPDNWDLNWHHVNGSYKDNILKLYIDGELVGEKRFDYSIGHFKDIIRVGGNNSYTHFDSMNGVLDEVKLFHKALSIDEIKNMSLYKNHSKVLWNNFDNLEKYISNQRGTYLATGGDFNDSPNDSSFCSNGILLSSRKRKPEVYEIKKIYQNIEVKDKDILNGEILIKNKHLFKNLSDYKMKWEYLVDGEIYEGGESIINLSPLSSSVFKINDIDKILDLNGREFLINISFLLIEDTLWGCKGFEISRDQIKIPIDNDILEASSLVNDQNFNIEEDNNNIYIKSDDFFINFDKSLGGLNKYDFRGYSLINSLVVPEFWNPLNDNERLYKIYDKVCFWRGIWSKNENPTCDIKKEENGTIKVTFIKSIKELNDSLLYTTYEINSIGDIKVKLCMEVLKKGIPHARSIGFKLFLNKDLNNITFYGRGPFENYKDRNSGSYIGIYNTNINKQFTDYVTPQRTGNMTDVRWICFNDGEKGILFKEDVSPLQINSSEYSDKEFEKKHSYQMKKFSSIIVNIRWKDYGSAFESFEDECIDYIEDDNIYTTSFILTPFIKGMNPKDLWKKNF